jgi:uncharacterized small protein (DUF1192 family)
MKFETILRAYRKSTIMNILVFLMDSKRTSKFGNWLLRHDEKQAAEIARLQAELDGDDLMAGEAEMFRPEYEKQLEAEIERLQAQVAKLREALEDMISEAQLQDSFEDWEGTEIMNNAQRVLTMKAGMPGE